MVTKSQCQCICLATIFVIGTLASLAESRSLNAAPVLENHKWWMAHYGRVYVDDDERSMRSKLYEENVRYIESVNKANNRPYKLGINEFADLTNEEFKTARNRFKSHVSAQSTALFRYQNVTAVPSAMDWRKNGAVTPVKDQGQCGKNYSANELLKKNTF